MRLDQLRDGMGPGGRVVPGALQGQGSDGGQAKIEGTDIGRRGMETGEGVLKGLCRDTVCKLRLDVVKGQAAQVADLRRID